MTSSHRSDTQPTTLATLSPHDAPADAAGVDSPRRPVDVARRAVITGALTVAGGAALVACGSSGSSADTTTSSSSSTSSTSSSKSAGSAGSGAGSAVIVKLADVPVGSAVSATLDGKKIVVAQPTKGKVVAFSAICTHMGCTVAPSGGKLNCPCHGSVFDAATGKHLSGPAPSPLPAVPVKLNASGDGVVSA
jgi:cytochrome b6-f complex iron-sulfur subunit